VRARRAGSRRDPVRDADPGTRGVRAGGAAAPDAPVRAQGRHLAQEDRARADRPRRRPQADDDAAGGAVDLQPDPSQLPGRRARGCVRWGGLMTDPRETEDTLRRLEERLDRASAAAERLMAEA